MGFHPLKVWQFWQGMLRLPCGLRELADDCDCVPDGLPPGSNASAMTKCSSTVDPKVLPNPFEQEVDYETETSANVSKVMRKNSNPIAQQAYWVGNCCGRLHKYMLGDGFCNFGVYEWWRFTKAAKCLKM